jgi:hypothetical protein
MAELSGVRGDIAANTVRALHKIGEDLGGKAQRLAPIEEGTLRASMAVVLIVNGTRFEGEGSIDAAIATARRLAEAGDQWAASVEVSFNTVYAAYQHEETSLEHPLGGQAKYLEQPFREGLPRYERIIAAAASASM